MSCNKKAAACCIQIPDNTGHHMMQKSPIPSSCHQSEVTYCRVIGQSLKKNMEWATLGIRRTNNKENCSILARL